MVTDVIYRTDFAPAGALDPAYYASKSSTSPVSLHSETFVPWLASSGVVTPISYEYLLAVIDDLLNEHLKIPRFGRVSSEGAFD